MGPGQRWPARRHGGVFDSGGQGQQCIRSHAVRHLQAGRQMMTEDPERNYLDAKAALKARDYDRASGLLKQILVIDDDYKDASRLLAEAVKLKRRRWYNDPRLWTGLSATLLIGLGVWLAPRTQDLFARRLARSAAIPAATYSPANVPTAAATIAPMPTPIPLRWTRISLGQEFPRDAVTAFAVDVQDPEVIYASMKNAGVYKTIDSGMSWRPAHKGLSNTQVQSLLIDFNSPLTLYAGTLGGAFKTRDGGENWERIGAGVYLLLDYQESAHLYARDDAGIFESRDGGATWETTHSLGGECPASIGAWDIHPTQGNTIFVGSGLTCEMGVYKSEDGGRSWILLPME